MSMLNVSVNAVFRWCMFTSVLHVHISMLHVHASCSCCFSVLLAHHACPFSMSILHVNATCLCFLCSCCKYAASPCCMSTEFVTFMSMSSRCMSMLHGHAACPHCMSMLHVHAAWTWCMNMKMNMNIKTYKNSRELTVLPSASLILDNIGFIYPFYVYDCNRPLAPILRQRWCSLMYDVYWLALDDDEIEIPGIQSRIRIEYFPMNNELRKLNRTKWLNEQWTKVEQQTNNKSNNNNNNTR